MHWVCCGWLVWSVLVANMTCQYMSQCLGIWPFQDCKDKDFCLIPQIEILTTHSAQHSHTGTHLKTLIKHINQIFNCSCFTATNVAQWWFLRLINPRVRDLMMQKQAGIILHANPCFIKHCRMDTILLNSDTKQSFQDFEYTISNEFITQRLFFLLYSHWPLLFEIKGHQK